MHPILIKHKKLQKSTCGIVRNLIVKSYIPDFLFPYPENYPYLCPIENLVSLTPFTSERAMKRELGENPKLYP
jgi:hypothetical protein